MGTLECRLCLTLHVNEGSYLAHTQGKKHQTNLARRAAKDNRESTLMIRNVPHTDTVKKKVFVKIGRPGEFGLGLGFGAGASGEEAIEKEFWHTI